MPMEKKSGKDRVMERYHFVAAGAIVFSALVLVLAAEVFWYSSTVDTAIDDALEATAVTHPDRAWLIGEWRRCNRGEGDYRVNGYLERAQCDLAVTHQASGRGYDAQEAEAALEALRRTVDETEKSVWIPWPLSSFAGDAKTTP